MNSPSTREERSRFPLGVQLRRIVPSLSLKSAPYYRGISWPIAWPNVQARALLMCRMNNWKRQVWFVKTFKIESYNGGRTISEAQVKRTSGSCGG